MTIKRFGLWVWMLLCVVAFSACNDDDELDYNKLIELYGDWKAENDKALQKIANDSSYTAIESVGHDGSVYVKVQKEGKGKEPIYFTDSVKAFYSLWTIDGRKLDSREAPYDNAITLGVGTGAIDGWGVAVQNMHVGDRWEVWMPYQLGYGIAGDYNTETGSYSVLPFSTLHYEIEIVSIIRNNVEITK